MKDTENGRPPAETAVQDRDQRTSPQHTPTTRQTRVYGTVNVPLRDLYHPGAVGDDLNVQIDLGEAGSSEVIEYLDAIARTAYYSRAVNIIGTRTSAVEMTVRFVRERLAQYARSDELAAVQSLSEDLF